MSDRPDADTSTHLDTQHSVTLLWMSDRPDAYTSTLRHTTLDNTPLDE